MCENRNPDPENLTVVDHNKIELGSSIHTDHIDTFYKNTHESLWNFWKFDATNVEDWNKIFEYDPYYGQLPPGVEDNGG